MVVVAVMFFSSGSATPLQAPFINSIHNGVATIWDPSISSECKTGHLSLKDVNTETEYEVPLIPVKCGPGYAVGIYNSGLPRFEGTQIILHGFLNDGREIYIDQDVMTFKRLLTYLSVMIR
jgi:hypothetical protein